MKKLSEAVRRTFNRFDTSLFFPPKEQAEKKNFKGQTVKKRDFTSGGPMPSVE